MTDDLATQWADLADLICNLAREILFTAHSNDELVHLAPSEQNVMRFIDRNPGATASEVAHGTSLQRSNLSTALKSLEDKGLVERRTNDEDGRGVRLLPTSLAEANLAILRREWALALSTSADASKETLDGVVDLLARVDAGLVRNRLARP
jgi:DNA-binding MarR family transcriptional regulator